jgi:hypothetical protein
MIKLRTLPLAAALIFSSTPAMAQDLADIFGPGPNPITMFKEVFKAEPLTPAEETRLPAAQQLANSLIPPGSYGAAFEGAFAPMADKVMAMVEPDTATKAAQLTNLTKYDVENLDDAKLASIVALLDPQAAQRNKQLADFVFAEFAAAMVEIEPLYRDGLARAYAKHFTDAQLAEVNAFFATPTGNRFAATSVAMQLDPQMMAKVPDMIPVMVGHVAEAATRFVMAMDTFPQARKVDSLSARERTQMLNLLGLTDEEYEARITASALDFEWDDESLDEYPPVMEVPLEGELEEVE